jgi:3-deoxy-D-manno-octulosonic-acid transferase
MLLAADAAGVLVGATLARALLRLRPQLVVGLAATSADAAMAAGTPAQMPDQVRRTAPPADTLPAARGFLAAWRPEVMVICGGSVVAGLPAALIAQAHGAGCPVLLAESRLDTPPPGLWQRAVLRALLARTRRVLLPDQRSASWLARLGVPEARLLVTGTITEPNDPLPCTEAERAALAGQLHTRPVWFAVNVPEAEEAAVLAAHEQALQHAHRLLLIIAPESPDRAAALAASIEALGLVLARRALEQEPEEDVQVLLVDDLSELGLWYRLAPVSWLGGTLSGGGAPRPPFEAAALGSAILHGPNTAPHTAEFARLTGAHATRQVASPAALAEAVAELIAPDKVATLAHDAWLVTLDTNGGAERAARVVLQMVQARGGAAAAVA